MAETSLIKYSTSEKLNKMDVDLITVSPDIAEATYSDGDLMAEQETISNAASVSGGSCILQSISAIDTSDTGGTIYVLISDNSADLGTVGDAVNAGDAAADNSMAIITLSNWTDVGGSKVCTKSNLGHVMKAVDGSKDLYFGVVNVSGGNIVIGSGEDIVFRFGIVKD
tara:strand:- start:1472 stop:1975 length:504 start_codon:yes stop_codon:yes gene_type:complete